MSITSASDVKNYSYGIYYNSHNTLYGIGWIDVTVYGEPATHETYEIYESSIVSITSSSAGTESESSYSTRYTGLDVTVSNNISASADGMTYYPYVTVVPITGVMKASYKTKESWVTVNEEALTSSTYISNQDVLIYYSTLTQTLTATSFQVSYTRTTESWSRITLSSAGQASLKSTYTSLNLYESTNDSGYTYKTTFYGTIEAKYEDFSFSDSSWNNIAAVNTSSTSESYLDVPRTYEGATYESRSSFGIPGYNLSTVWLLSSSSQGNNPSASARKSTTQEIRISSIETTSGVSNISLYTTSFISYSSSSFTLSDFVGGFSVNFTIDKQDFNYYQYYSKPIHINSSSYSTYLYDSSSSTGSSYSYNTVKYGTTARISDMISSSSWVNVFNTYLISNVRYAYNISSLWIYSEDSITETLSEYSTMLTTSFKLSYVTGIKFNSVSFTASTSTNILTTEDRYINRNGISRSETNVISYTNTVAYYNVQAMATINQSSSTYTYNSETSVSRLTYTFITSSADFSSVESVITTRTTSIGKQQFRNSFSTVMNSTSEQQNDTLIFQSTVATISTYNASTALSTLSTMQVDYNATTYTDEYNPKSYSTIETKVSTSMNVDTTLSSRSDIVQVTQSISFTPTYSDVNGIYVTE